MFREPSTNDAVGWKVMYGITSILGAYGGGTLGQSDWTRYANRRFAPTLSQLVAAPITITVTAVIGIIATSAANDFFGKIIWNPIYLLADIQEVYHSSPRARAGVFFASIGMVSSQLAVSPVSPLNVRTMLKATGDIRRTQFHIGGNGYGRFVSKIHQH
jgi:nucleobase:cation symporter-1, NCS1 family